MQYGYMCVAWCVLTFVRIAHFALRTAHDRHMAIQPKPKSSPSHITKEIKLEKPFYVKAVSKLAAMYRHIIIRC